LSLKKKQANTGILPLGINSIDKRGVEMMIEERQITTFATARQRSKRPYQEIMCLPQG